VRTFLESEAGRRLLSRVPMGRAGNLAELDGPRAPGTVRRIDTRNEPEQGSRGFTTA